MENFQDRGVWIRIRIRLVLRGWIRIRSISDRICNPAHRDMQNMWLGVLFIFLAWPVHPTHNFIQCAMISSMLIITSDGSKVVGKFFVIKTCLLWFEGCADGVDQHKAEHLHAPHQGQGLPSRRGSHPSVTGQAISRHGFQKVYIHLTLGIVDRAFITNEWRCP